MTACSYCLHGLRITIAAPEPIQAALQSRLARFPASAGDAHPSLHFEFQRVSDLARQGVRRPRGQPRPVFDLGLGEVVYFDDIEQLYMEIPGAGRALADPLTGHVMVSYLEAAALDPWLLSHPFFTIPLNERCKRLGRYALHAAGLAVNGRGLLVAGASGSGKTTLAITLLRAGFEFLGDDTVFLTSDQRVLAFPDEIDVTAHTASFFPELEALAARPPAGQRPKRGICPSRTFGISPGRECEPAVLVFPQPSPSAHSVLGPLAPAEALVTLCENVVRTEPRSSQAHLDALAALVRRCRCYRLQTGRDLDSLPARLRSVLLHPPSHSTREPR